MQEQEIKDLLSLGSKQALAEIQLFDEIDSTNAQAIREIQSGRLGSRLVLAGSQSAGRGRRGRAWYSEPGAGIYMSMVREFDLPVDSLQALSLVTALSIQQALEGLGVEGLQLKWPNDLLYKKQKLAGILLELQRTQASNHVVIGIGLNLKLPAQAFAEIERPVTDIASISDAPPSAQQIAAAMCNCLIENIDQFEVQGFTGFQEAWNSLDCYKGSDIVIGNGKHRSLGQSMGVDADGFLLLHTASGIQRINGGEIFPSLRAAEAGELP